MPQFRVVTPSKAKGSTPQRCVVLDCTEATTNLAGVTRVGATSKKRRVPETVDLHIYDVPLCATHDKSTDVLEAVDEYTAFGKGRFD